MWSDCEIYAQLSGDDIPVLVDHNGEDNAKLTQGMFDCLGAADCPAAGALLAGD